MKTLNSDIVKDIDMAKLLGREEIVLDEQVVGEHLSNKTIMITGGGGTIGSELCRQIAKFNPYKIIILDIYENSTYELQQELIRSFPNLRLEVIIASVRDARRINRIFEKHKPQIVFHAAAHKHVPLMENDPWEAIKNNIAGTWNVAEACVNARVSKFVLISTDKAVNPTNIMGATKRFCEMMIQSFHFQNAITQFSAVRFGNVLGSNGSVVPLFKKQIAYGGPLTLTHTEVTRYFMTIPEASQLILQACTYAKGGEIFILDMGEPVKIYDLAKNMIKLSGVDTVIEVVGLRPGEKLYEELLMEEESSCTNHKKIFVANQAYYNMLALKIKMNELLAIADEEDLQKLKSKIKEAVPTYTGGN